jgi:starch phosphorylase
LRPLVFSGTPWLPDTLHPRQGENPEEWTVGDHVRELHQRVVVLIEGSPVHSVRESCVFTTHTPVPAAFDKFPRDLATSVLSPKILRIVEPFLWEDTLNMTYLALNLSHYVNGVANMHGETSRLMFADYQIDAITNGVHAASWVSKPFQALFDRYVPGWREDNQSRLRKARGNIQTRRSRLS